MSSLRLWLCACNHLSLFIAAIHCLLILRDVLLLVLIWIFTAAAACHLFSMELVNCCSVTRSLHITCIFSNSTAVGWLNWIEFLEFYTHTSCHIRVSFWTVRYIDILPYFWCIICNFSAIIFCPTFVILQLVVHIGFYVGFPLGQRQLYMTG